SRSRRGGAGARCRPGGRRGRQRPPGPPRSRRVGDPDRLLPLQRRVHRALPLLPRRCRLLLPALPGDVRADAQHGARRGGGAGAVPCALDARFRFAGGRWRARVHDALARSLTDVSFVAVDLETTGDGPAASGIIEIGAVRVEGGRLGESFVTLVDPGRPINPFVVRLTGITDAMVAGAPTIQEALPRFLAFARDGVLVAHNAGFDVGHLDAAQRLVAGRPLDLPALCTLKLARRLMPELRRRSLDAVAGALGIGCAGRHRALPDARIAAEILTVFLERAA